MWVWLVLWLRGVWLDGRGAAEVEGGGFADCLGVGRACGLLEHDGFERVGGASAEDGRSQAVDGVEFGDDGRELLGLEELAELREVEFVLCADVEGWNGFDDEVVDEFSGELRVCHATNVRVCLRGTSGKWGSDRILRTEREMRVRFWF